MDGIRRLKERRAPRTRKKTLWSTSALLPSITPFIMSDGNSAVMIVRHLSKEQRDALIERVSRYYPLTKQTIDQYPLLWDWKELSSREDLPWSQELIARHEDRWLWSGYRSLSGNDGLPWSETLIARFEDRWDWEQLTKRDLPWSEDLILQFEDRWDWKELSRRESLPWSEQLVKRFENRWDWDKLSKNEALSWSEELIGRFEDRWTEVGYSEEWYSLSRNKSLPWGKELIGRFEDQWGWSALSKNESIPWSKELIARYEDQWDWSNLSANEALPWSKELIASYENRWSWGEYGLSKNEALPWSEELIACYEDRWEWEGRRSLSNNEALPWSEELIARFEDRWDWERLSEREDLPWSGDLIERFEDRWYWKGGWGVNDDDGLSVNEALSWSKELVAQHEDRWNWEAVSRNELLPWDEELIARFEDRWDWSGLSKNEALPWSEELIARYEDRWTWSGLDSLSKNEALPWSEELIARYEGRWENFFSEKWENLSENEVLPWSGDLIERFEDKWDWEALSANEGLPWSPHLVERFEDQWTWSGPDSLSGNRALPLSRDLVARFADRWNWRQLRSELITECISDEDIQQILAAASSGFTFSEERQRLHKAAQDGDVPTIRDMLDSGTDPDIGLTADDAPDVALSTPLLEACKEGHTAVAEVLVDAGAALNVTSKNGRTALDFVAENGPLPLARLLLSAGADPTVSEAEDLPGLAHENGHTAVADVLHIGSTLLEHDPEFETVGDEGKQRPFERAFGSTESGDEDPMGDVLEAMMDGDMLEESDLDLEPSAFDLLRAVRDRGSAFVQELLDQGADPNATAADRHLTPLLVATAFGQPDVADCLLQDSDHPAFWRSLGEKTCLMVAATCGEAEIVSSLLEAGASISMQSRDGQPRGNGNRKFHRSAALTYAIYGGHVETVRTILEKADEKSPDPPAKLLRSTEIAGHPLTSTNQALLHPAVREGHLRMVKLLLKYGADNTQTDDNGRVPLDIAEAAGRDEVARLLLRHEERKSETEENSQSGESPEPSALDQELIDAASEGSIDRVEQLIDEGADPNVEGADPNVKDESKLPLIRHLGVSDAEVLKVLLEAGADPNARGEYSLGDLGGDLPRATRLHDWFGTDSEIAEHLLEAGADPNARDSRWATPLFYHVYEVRQENISEELLSLLLEAGADPNAKTSTSRVPLHGARGDSEVTRLLLNAGADPNIPGNHEERDFPLHSERDPEIMSLLLEAGADPNALNRQRLTPLMLAMKGSLGTLEQMECLLENGADPNIQNANGEAALHLLAENTDPDADFRRDATSLLLRHGANDYLERRGNTPYEIAKHNDNFAVMDALQED